MLLGIPGDNTYSNYAEANRAFYRQTVVPLISRIAAALGHWLGESFGGNLRLVPDLDEVPALSIEREALWKRIGEASFLTDDEKREATGYEPLPASSLLAKYSPDQPRVPGGNPDGGQWTSGGGSGVSENDDEADASEAGDLEQSLSTARDQEPREDLAHLQAIANDPIISRGIDAAWSASRPDSDEPREHGFWISRSNITGELFTRPFANPGTQAQITPGTPPSDAIAFFHTHPNRLGFRTGPSSGDISFANYYKLPGILRSHNGIYYFGPILTR
jgi:hypothetical protein